jgi:release factor glutamine methyltransferase
VLAFDAPARVLDLCTGSGAVALAVAHDRPRAQVLGTDVSEAALAVARGNASRLGFRNVAFLRADLFDGLPGSPDTDPQCGAVAPPFDAIVANPPYVGTSDPHLGEGDLRFEPVGALAAGADGLDVLRPLIAQAPSHLAPGGYLAVEHGHDQADAVRALFEAAGLAEVRSVRDLAGIPRVVCGRARGG